MCCHLTNEQDALYIATILCEHSSQLPPKDRLNVNAQDKQLNSALHHAAMARKPALAKYLVEQLSVDLTQKNIDGLLAVDLAQSKDFKLLLQKFQKPQDLKKLGKQKSKAAKVKSQTTAKAVKGSALEFKSKYARWQKEKSEKMKGALAAGGMAMDVGNAIDTAPSEKMQLQDFKILNRVGVSKSNVFLACCKKHGKNLAKEQLFAIKIVEKSQTSHHVRYDLETKKSISSVV
jgi:ankyrin repeat protein